MIKEKDIERWYDSAHYRKKCDWICIDQPKVINEWGPKDLIGQVVFSETAERPRWAKDLPCLNVQHNWLRQITGKPTHSGMMIVIERPAYKVSSLMKSNRVLLLDGIQDPGNLGTIMRSMVAFGCRALCLTQDCVDPFHPKVVSASAGAIAHIGIYYETHWEKWLKTTTHPIYVLDPLAFHSLWNTKQPETFVLVCGSEGRGIHSELIKSVSILPISIPMADETESLNAGVSVSLGLSHLSRPTK